MSKKLLRFKVVLVLVLLLIGFVVHAEEKKSDSSIGKTVSGLTGAFVGGTAGAAVCAPAGPAISAGCSAVGGAIGYKVGEKVWENKRTIVEKVKDAISEYGQRRAKEDAKNPWRHKD